MKKKNLDELKSKSLKQLKEFIESLEKEIINSRLETGQSKIKNVHVINQKRKDIARAKTITQAKLFLEKKENKNVTN